MGKAKTATVFLLMAFLITNSIVSQPKQRVKTWGKRIAVTVLIVAVSYTIFLWRSDVCKVLMNILPVPAEAMPQKQDHTTAASVDNSVGNKGSQQTSDAKQPEKPAHPAVIQMANVVGSLNNQGRPPLRPVVKQAKAPNKLSVFERPQLKGIDAKKRATEEEKAKLLAEMEQERNPSEKLDDLDDLMVSVDAITALQEMK